VRIRITYDPPPIPDRSHDWRAVDDDTYDGEGCPIGYGRTPGQAVDDLVWWLDERGQRHSDAVHRDAADRRRGCED
jgi:hypothetical protein